VSSKYAENLRQHFSRYLEAPTQQRQTVLITAAEQYRENWIEAQAAEKPSQNDLNDDSQAATRYRRIHSVLGRQPDGTEITLALQSRTSLREGHTWNVVSWRTRLGPGGHNRRFYVSKGDVWNMAAKTALEMFSKLEQLGGLDEKYIDLERNPDFQVTVSDDVNTIRRSALLKEITMPGESWGEDPFFVVLNDPHESWRKIILVNRETGIATFRSTTTDENYMPRKTLRPGTAWYLDNSMQDTNIQQARVMLQQLRRIVQKLD
jgi:hypothetical protein